MIIIHKHGKKEQLKTEHKTCPLCGCEFDYTQDEIGEDGLHCPECLMVWGNKVPSNEGYERNIAKELIAINECLGVMDFHMLAKGIKALKEAYPDEDEGYGWLSHDDPEELYKIAEEALSKCFDEMFKYHNRTTYGDGSISYDFEVEGIFMVDTHYFPDEDEYTCFCRYNIMSGSSV